MFLFFALALILAGQDRDRPRKTIWDGVYTAAQAERGRGVYETHCFECHNGDLDPLNTASRLIGARFMDRWREDSLGNLFHFVSTSMPRNAPATLTESAYLDALTFLLQLNKAPAGTVELKKENVEGIRVEYSDGPRPLPSNSLVQLVGCLNVDPDETWTLTHASEPARTRRTDDATSEEMKAAEAAALGTQTFRLANFAYLGSFRPLDHIGHKMFAKGTVIRQTNRERINLTFIKMIDAACDP